MKYLLTFCLLACLPLLLMADIAPVPYHMQPYILNSGSFDGSPGDAQPVLMYSEVVRVSRVPWIRLSFNDAYLGEGSYLLIRSLLDGGTQRLDATSLEQWQYSSAYFNGEAVEVQMFVAPSDRGIFISIREVMIGEWAPGETPESQCGPTDDRMPSTHPAAGRVLNIGCTAWIICDGRHVSAGHCVESSGLLNTLEFNVPPSTGGGTIVHPPPEDQYAANTSTRVYTNGGIGNDWGVFEVFPNSITGLLPIEAQGAHFEVEQNLGPPDIRITGYGVDFDDPERNQTQQTHVGPNAGSSGTTMRYQTDTEGGNSGSPVINDANGFSVGVHTHGGCSTGGGGNNSGTSLFHTSFWAEVTANPCGGGTLGCEDLSSFLARCNNQGTIQARVRASGDWTGTTVTISVDGTPYVINAQVGGLGTQWKLQIPDGGTGSHTVSLKDPAGCYSDIVVTCATDQPSGWEWDDDAGWGGTSELNSTVGSTTTMILGNYPNPFNPSTTIRYLLAEETNVTLKVYNMLGQEVATLVNGVQYPGEQSVVWHGTNDFGQAVSSGLYIYRIQTDNNVLTEKMMFMK